MKYALALLLLLTPSAYGQSWTIGPQTDHGYAALSVRPDIADWPPFAVATVGAYRPIEVPFGWMPSTRGASTLLVPSMPIRGNVRGPVPVQLESYTILATGLAYVIKFDRWEGQVIRSNRGGLAFSWYFHMTYYLMGP